MCGVCTARARAMLGTKSGFQAGVKYLAPKAESIYTMIHQYALASKTPRALPEGTAGFPDQNCKLHQSRRT